MEQPKEIKDKIARNSASGWCRCFKCDGIIRDCNTKCDKDKLLTCKQWYHGYRTAVLALDDYKNELLKKIQELEDKNNCGTSDFIESKRIAFEQVKALLNENNEIDEDYVLGKCFTGLIPCWIDAPSTLQPAYKYHGKNIVAVHLKGGGYRCCIIDDITPSTFYLPENTHLVEGWKIK